MFFKRTKTPQKPKKIFTESVVDGVTIVSINTRVLTPGHKGSNQDTSYRELAYRLDEISREQHTLLIIDLSQTGYLISTSLGLLIQVLVTLKQSGGKLVLSGCNDDTLGKFRLTKLFSVFEFAEDVDTAVKYIKKLDRY